MKTVVMVMALMAFSVPVFAKKRGRGPASPPPFMQGLQAVQEKCGGLRGFPSLVPPVPPTSTGDDDREARRAAMESQMQEIEASTRAFVATNINSGDQSIRDCLAVLPPEAVCGANSTFVESCGAFPARPARPAFTGGAKPDPAQMREQIGTYMSNVDTALACARQNVPAQVNAIDSFPNQSCIASVTNFESHRQEMQARRQSGGGGRDGRSAR